MGRINWPRIYAEICGQSKRLFLRAAQWKSTEKRRAEMVRVGFLAPNVVASAAGYSRKAYCWHDPLVFVALGCWLGLVAAWSIYFPARWTEKADLRANSFTSRVAVSNQTFS